jgi:hypothetical protein
MLHSTTYFVEHLFNVPIHRQKEDIIYFNEMPFPPVTYVCMISLTSSTQFCATLQNAKGSCKLAPYIPVSHSLKYATIILLCKGKAIRVTGCVGPYSFEKTRLRHFLDNLLTDGGEVVSSKHRPLLTPSKILVNHLC